MKDVVLDEINKVFIDEKEYIKLKSKMNKSNDYFNKEEIEALYKLR